VNRVLAIDLALGLTGLVLLPEGWVSEGGIHWDRLRFSSIRRDKLPTTAPEADRIHRVQSITLQLLGVVEAWKPTHVVFEEHSFSKGNQVFPRGELSGVVKHKLALGRSLPVDTIHANSARKTLLGKCPRKDAKAAAVAYCKELGVPWGHVKKSHGYEDICDAFVIGNHYLGVLGGVSLTREVTC
jgi:Holliday junction resolvasome RuvABC endonuclease subunit